LHFLARRNAFRFHVSDKLIDPRIAMQALDVGINLRLSRTPSRVSGILGMQSVYTLGRGWFGHGSNLPHPHARP
jgi:hypothetical protein